MPAIFNSLVHSRGLTPHVAWRVAYIVPFILITATAVGMLLLCDDTPTGKWSDRHLIIEGEPASPPPEAVAVQGLKEGLKDGSMTKDKSPEKGDPNLVCIEQGQSALLDMANGEIIMKPTFREGLTIIFSRHTLALAAPYACSFGTYTLPPPPKLPRKPPPLLPPLTRTSAGGELALNSIIGAYYFKNFPHLGETGSGNWAAMFGLLNVAFRPAGGMLSDAIYRRTGSVRAKKLWMSLLGVAMGVLELAIGLADPRREAAMFGLFAGLAFFVDASNGANFSVVPHVYPAANGGFSCPSSYLVMGAFC